MSSESQRSDPFCPEGTLIQQAHQRPVAIQKQSGSERLVSREPSRARECCNVSHDSLHRASPSASVPFTYVKSSPKVYRSRSMSARRWVSFGRFIT
jgi:hypothetical protein